MVKTLHSIENIAARISQAGVGQVRLAREADASCAENGSKRPATSIDAAATLDPVAATLAALAKPLDFPPLSAGIVPGDRIAIAVDEAVPCAAGIVRGAVEALESGGIEREAISIMTRDAETSRLCRDEFVSDRTSSPHFVVHDPGDGNNLCPIGVTKRGEPLLINRTIFDADVVLPVGCARPNRRGPYDCLFPRFSNAEAIQRYRTPANRESAKVQQARNRETNEAGWMIGVPMVIEVVPGSGDTVAHVLAGEPQAVTDKSGKLSRQRWSFRSPQRVSLVIATVTGGPQSQTWGNIGRALANAQQLVEDGGAVAICCNLDEPPGESLGRLMGSTDLAATQRKISHDHAADSEAAWQIARALQRGPIYFLSQLNPDTVEDLGLAPVADVNELVRLASRHDSCAVVEDAQNAVVTVEGEANEP